jgi:hypothetical protein
VSGPVHVVEYELTDEVAARMMGAVARTARRGMWSAVGVLGALVGGAAAAAVSLDAPRPLLMLAGAGIGAWMTLCFIGLNANRGGIQSYLARVRSYPHRRVRWEFHEQGYRVEMAVERSEGSWIGVTGLHVHPEYWALDRSGLLYPIPRAPIGDATRVFLRRKATEARARVHENDPDEPDWWHREGE